MNLPKRTAVLLLALTLAAASLPFSANAGEILPRAQVPTELPAASLQPLPIQPPADAGTMAVTAGTCGENVYWTLDGDELNITGTGDMILPDDGFAPWCESSNIIRTVNIAEGVTSICEGAFARCSRLLDCFIPASVRYVGSYAFLGVSSGRLYFLGEAPEFAEDALDGFEFMAFHFRPWDEAVMQDYGGSPTWKRGTVILSSANKQLYGLNEEIRAEDLLFQAYIYEHYPFVYTPGEVTVGEYDNSTYGHKTVSITADGFELTYEYDVTDGENHLQQLHVEYEPMQYYRGYPIYVDPVVMAEDRVLSNEYYSISYENNMEVGTDASFTITGLGIYEGFQQTYPFAILKTDLEGAFINMEDTGFYGMPMEPEVAVYHNGFFLDPETDYTVVYENNVNVGNATVRIIGRGGYCGEISRTFEIRQQPTDVYLDGAYNGNAYDGVLNDDVYYFEGLLPPGPFTGIINCQMGHAAYYMFYQIQGDEAVLLEEYETPFGAAGETCFAYDFTDVYDRAVAEGGEAYMLVYSWIDVNYDVYSGACVMYIPARVPEALSMVMESAGSGLGREYLTVYSEDGALEPVTWTSSDETVADVAGGTVTLKTPGTVTITAQSGDLTASREIKVTALELGGAVVFDAAGTIIYDGRILTEGTDYTLTVTETDGLTEVAAVGKGLFTGQILRQFDENGMPLGHTHTFENACDAACGGCDFTKETGHRFGDWVKDGEGHWHACAVCGETADYAAHTRSEEDPTLCTVCGPLYTPGDLDGNGEVNEDDAIYLLQYVLLPEFFPVSQTVDYNGDGQVNEDDAIYLLQHVLLPEFFPL